MPPYDRFSTLLSFLAGLLMMMLIFVYEHRFAGGLDSRGRPVRFADILARDIASATGNSVPVRGVPDHLCLPFRALDPKVHGYTPDTAASCGVDSSRRGRWEGDQNDRGTRCQVNERRPAARSERNVPHASRSASRPNHNRAGAGV